MSESPLSPSLTEPQVRGTAFFGLRAAVDEMWGPSGVRAFERRLDDEVRARVVEQIVTPQAWIPERHLIHVCASVLAGPAQGDEAAFRAVVARSCFHGWGRFQRLILGVVSPSVLAARAPALWRRDHTHGELEIRVGEAEAAILIADSAYGESEFSRLLIAETFRSILAMTRVASGARVREEHGMDHARRVAIRLSWAR